LITARYRSRIFAKLLLVLKIGKMQQSHYIQHLQSVIRHLHGCESAHLGTEFVRELINGKIAWHQTVERFAVTGHPRAAHCYAWTNNYSNTQGQHYIAVLELPPIRNASDAVKYSMLANESRILDGTTRPSPSV
jgi:hypothetical protein